MFDLVDSIKNSKLFNNVTLDEIIYIVNKAAFKEVNFTKGKSIFSTYLNAQYVGIIVSGIIHIEKLIPCGKSVLMYKKQNGDILGEVAAFSDTEFYPCDAISTTDGKILIFNKQDFFELIYSNKEVTKNFLNLVCNKAYSLNNHIGSLSYTSAKQKVAQSILSYSRQEDSDMLKMPYSKKIWADRLNISRASLYRELDALCQASIISLEKKSIIAILNKEKLETITLN